MNKYICDKCGSTEVKETIVTDYKEPEPIKMTEFKGISMCLTLEYRPTHYKLTCEKCGFTHDYIQ